MSLDAGQLTVAVSALVPLVSLVVGLVAICAWHGIWNKPS
jgi:hypothetical protein